MRRRVIFNFSFLIVLLTLAACHKPATEQQTPSQEAPVVVVDPNAFIDITGVTPGGAELSLSDLVGKSDYLLLDFWASWCGPCRRFIPVLKEMYAGQPEGRFQILSCSIDKDANAWQIALEEEQMPWPQMCEDATHECSDLYDVQYIPHTVLIDREGKIVGVNLEEPEIEEILFGE